MSKKKKLNLGIRVPRVIINSYDWKFKRFGRLEFAKVKWLVDM